MHVAAERRAGQMLAEMPKNEGAKGIGPIAVTSYDRNTPTLSDQGITKNESSRWQKLAAIDDVKFEQAVAPADLQPKLLSKMITVCLSTALKKR